MGKLGNRDRLEQLSADDKATQGSIKKKEEQVTWTGLMCFKIRICCYNLLWPRSTKCGGYHDKLGIY